ncbi:hypothetical protein ASG40_11885 [Methylobacterium sp. Leaf399]|nr:hypothetical protein ASG40_11885 [Methylobacterium sp. Leaf399]
MTLWFLFAAGLVDARTGPARGPPMGADCHGTAGPFPDDSGMPLRALIGRAIGPVTSTHVMART